MEENTHLDNDTHYDSMMTHCGDKNLKMVSKDTKCILSHSPGPGESAVEDPLLTLSGLH